MSSSGLRARPPALRILDEAEAKARLRAAGLSVPEGRRAASPQEATAVAAALGFPVAVKALGLAHKSERGGVRLGLRDAASVEEAAAPSSAFAVERQERT